MTAPNRLLNWNIVSVNVTTPKRPNRRALTLERLLKRLSSISKEYGTSRSIGLVIEYILRKALRIDWHGTIFLERSLADPIKEVIPRINVNIKLATINDLEKLKSLVDQEKYIRFQQRFKRGNICFIGLHGGEVVAFSWISFNNEYVYESDVELMLKDKEAYYFDAFVDPVYRNNKLHSAMIPPLFEYLRKLGYEKVIGLVDENNTYSLRTLAAAGYQPKKISKLINIFGLKFHRWREYTGKSDWR